MSWVPYAVLVVLFVGLITFTRRNRRRQAVTETERLNRIGVGTEVMTTSGLYATVVAKNDDGTVMLSIAPGVEVKWAFAALRDAASLSGQFRSAFDRPAGVQSDDSDPSEPGADDQAEHDADGGIDLRKDADDSE